MNPEGKFLFISNRRILPGNDDDSLFGEDFSERGPEDLNLATAVSSGKQGPWRFELLTDPGGVDSDESAIRQVFHDMRYRSIQDQDLRPWVLFVHGFNQSIKDNPRKCREIASYGARVIIFSWPSNPDPHDENSKIEEYKRALVNAHRSVAGLKRVMKQIAAYSEEVGHSDGDIRLVLAVHSLGNVVLEQFVRNGDFERETAAFDNILLNQADANLEGHREWLERLSRNSRVYVTINKKDRKLKLSAEGLKEARLGNTVQGLNAEGVRYMDFTNGLGVEDSHRPWSDPAEKNAAVHDFFKTVFHGDCGENVPGWAYNSENNSHRLTEREDP